MDMISNVCAELRNYFLPSYKNPQKWIHTGTFTLTMSGPQNLPFTLQDGQYYRIVGSLFNDGVWCYGSEENNMVAEEFEGAIWEMAVPRDFIELVNELVAVNQSVDTAAAGDTGYTSESFGGYSYTKRNGISDELLDRRKRAMDALNKRYRRLVVL